MLHYIILYYSVPNRTVLYHISIYCYVKLIYIGIYLPFTNI